MGGGELAALLHHYLHLSEGSPRDSGIQASSDSSSTSSSTQPLSPWERLVRTHSIWFLPSLTQEEATAILHNKDPGTFLVRRSPSHHSALSMKVGPSEAYAVHHYNIVEVEAGRMALEGSVVSFTNLLSLVHHYQSPSGELPAPLHLPEILRDTEGRHHLSSLAKLGKDFWRYPMSQPGRRSQLLLPPSTETPAHSMKAMLFPPSPVVERRVVRGPGGHRGQEAHRASTGSSVAQRPAPTPLSPPSARRRSIVSLLTVAPASHPGPPRHTLPGLQGREEVHLLEEQEEEEEGRMVESVHYFKSATEDKMSDYEDIWERGTESPGRLAISPTQSEQKFRQYLLSKFCNPTGGGEEECCSPSSCPSHRSSSPAPCTSSSSGGSELDSSSEGEEEEQLESPEPLAALEILTDMRVEEEEDEEDLVEEFSCSEVVEEEGVVEEVVAGSSVRGGSALRETLEKTSDCPETAWPPPAWPSRTTCWPSLRDLTPCLD